MMRKIGVTALLVVLAFLAGRSLGDPREAAQAQDGRKAGQWEYRVLPIDDLYPSLAPNSKAGRAKNAEEGTKTFNQLGAEGWEYAGYELAPGTIIFKRPKR